MAAGGTRCIVLAHLSRENNTPQRPDTVARPDACGGIGGAAGRPPGRVQSRLYNGERVVQKITVLCVGKLKEQFYLEAAAEYVKRLGRHCKLEVVELPESRLPEDPSPGRSSRRWRRRPPPYGKSCPGRGGHRPVHRGEALLQRGAEPPDAGAGGVRQKPADVPHRRQRGPS